MDDWKARILLWKLQHEKNEADKQPSLFPPEEERKIREANDIARKKLEELQRNARRKVERKPVLDDEGNEVPF